MDTCRTPVAGMPAPAFVEIYEITRKAHQAANALARPGVAAEDVDAAARDVIEKAGYGEQFMHRLGHGLGLDPHEEPYIIAGNKLKLLPGMVYSNEPGIYIDGKWGVRIEDIILMTQDGARSLNSVTRDIVTMN
jgi:Xaa-Pro aminopeptidase